MIQLLPLILALSGTGLQDVTAECAAPGNCRHVDTIHIEGADGTARDIPIDKTFPWVPDDNVMLFAGESVTVTLFEKDGALAPRLVRGGPSSIATPLKPGEIRFSLGDNEHGNILLKVESNRTDMLDYAALMVTEHGPQRTSVCTLQPGIAVFESWQEPILQLALWHFLPTKEPGCKTLKWGKGAHQPQS